MSKWSDSITLIKTLPPAEETNENGFPNSAEEESRSIFCNKKSVGYAEFYKAQQAGYKAELKVEVRIQDYDGEVLAEFDGRRYTILRTYESKNGEFTELTLTNLAERSNADGTI